MVAQERRQIRHYGARPSPSLKYLVRGHIDGYGRQRATTDRGCSSVGTGPPVTAPHAD